MADCFANLVSAAKGVIQLGNCGGIAGHHWQQLASLAAMTKIPNVVSNVRLSRSFFWKMNRKEALRRLDKY